MLTEHGARQVENITPHAERPLHPHTPFPHPAVATRRGAFAAGALLAIRSRTSLHEGANHVRVDDPACHHGTGVGDAWPADIPRAMGGTDRALCAGRQVLAAPHGRPSLSDPHATIMMRYGPKRMWSRRGSHAANPSGQHELDPYTHGCHRRALVRLCTSRVSFLVGGAYVLDHSMRMVRHTKDLDIFGFISPAE